LTAKRHAESSATENANSRGQGTSVLFTDGKKIVNPGCFAADGVGLPWWACSKTVVGKGNRIE
jgi:hypothetical protein